MYYDMCTAPHCTSRSMCSNTYYSTLLYPVSLLFGCWDRWSIFHLVGQLTTTHCSCTSSLATKRYPPRCPFVIVSPNNAGGVDVPFWILWSQQSLLCQSCHSTFVLSSGSASWSTPLTGSCTLQPYNSVDHRKHTFCYRTTLSLLKVAAWLNTNIFFDYLHFLNFQWRSFTRQHSGHQDWVGSLGRIGKPR